MIIINFFTILKILKGEITDDDTEKNTIRFGLLMKGEIVDTQIYKPTQKRNIHEEDIEYIDKTKLLEAINVPTDDKTIKYYHLSINTRGYSNITFLVNTKQYSFNIILDNNKIDFQESINSEVKNNGSIGNSMIYLVNYKSLIDENIPDIILGEDMVIFNNLNITWETYFHSRRFEQVIKLLNNYLIDMYDDFIVNYMDTCDVLNIKKTKIYFDDIYISEICDRIRNLDHFTDQDINLTKFEFINKFKDSIKSLYSSPREQLTRLLIPLIKNRDEDSTEREQEVLDLISEMYTMKNIVEYLSEIYELGTKAKYYRKILIEKIESN